MSRKIKSRFTLLITNQKQMDTLNVLVTCMNLLYYESKVIDKVDNSADLVRTVINKVFSVPKSNRKSTEIVTAVDPLVLKIKDLILELCDLPIDQELDKEYIKQRFDIYLVNVDKSTYSDNVKNLFLEFFKADAAENKIKRLITDYKKQLNNYYKKQSAAEIIEEASSEFKWNRVNDVNTFLADLISKLEVFQISNKLNDPAVLNEVDIGNDENLIKEFNDVRKLNNSDRIYKTGWTPFNELSQGGIRPGETVVINALQHKYKTGFSLTLFSQIALYNKPLNVDPNKKPLLLRISFEDDLASNLQFLYQYLKYNETREKPDIKNVSAEEMASYVKSCLQVNGFQIKMIRVDPTQWTFKSLFNKIIELEAQGYVIEVLMVDYLAMLPTIGCITTGATGTDIRDLLRRVRNFCSAKKIAFITPHQLSTEAKSLLRSGMPEDQFVKEINEKGYFAGSRQLDQEMDLEVYIHLFKRGKDETWLSVQRGKHRLPTIIPDSHKYYLMKFPSKGMPIPDSTPGVQDWYRKLPNVAGDESSSDLFA